MGADSVTVYAAKSWSVNNPPCARDAALTFIGAGVLFLPWLPNFIYQATHTAMVERIGPATADRAQCGREILLRQSIAGREGFAVVEKNRRNIGRGAKILGAFRQHVHIAASQYEPFLRELDGRCDQRGSRQGAVFLPRRLQAHDGSGNAHRQITVETPVADHLAARVEEHVGARCQRRALAKIDEGTSAVGEVNGHESAAAEIAAARMCHRQRVTDRHRGIDGIASLTQNCRAHLRGEVLRSHHHPLVRLEFEGRGRMTHHAGREQERDCYSVEHSH